MGSKEGAGGIGAFQLEQATQGPYTAAMGALLEGGSIAFETGVMASQELLFQRGDRGSPVSGLDDAEAAYDEHRAGR
jgi:hypothetical protein